MNLNLTILKDYLPVSLKPYLYGESQNKLVCSRPYLIDADHILKKGLTYILPANMLSFIQPEIECSIICVGGPVPFNWQESGAPILQLSGSSDFPECFNEICKIYDFFDQWESNLHNELRKQKDFDLKNILRLGAELFGNTINVTDHSLQIIFKASWITNSYGIKTLEINNNPHTFCSDTTNSIREVCNLERQLTVPYISSIQNMQFRSYCNNLYPLGYFTGCVSISESEHPFQNSDFPIADYYFRIFQEAFEKYLREFSSSNEPTNNALYKILHHTPLTPKEYKELKPDSSEILYCFKLYETNTTSCMPKDYMHAALCSSLPQILTSTIYHQKIIGLLKIEQNCNPTLVFESFKKILERTNYRAGISNSFSDLNQLEKGIIQADYSLSQKNNTLNFFTEYINSFLSHECVSRMSYELLTTEGLQRIIDYDKRKNTEYLHTLEALLNNEMNITPTAQDLYIHRSSLIKRINKLISLLQDDLTDADKRLYYRLWFMLKKYTHQKNLEST